MVAIIDADAMPPATHLVDREAGTAALCYSLPEGPQVGASYAHATGLVTLPPRAKPLDFTGTAYAVALDDAGSWLTTVRAAFDPTALPPEKALVVGWQPQATVERVRLDVRIPFGDGFLNVEGLRDPYGLRLKLGARHELHGTLAQYEQTLRSMRFHLAALANYEALCFGQAT